MSGFSFYDTALNVDLGDLSNTDTNSVNYSGTINNIDNFGVIGYGALSGAASTAGANFEVNVDGYATLDVNITGTWTGNLSFEYSSDGINWSTTNGITPGIQAIRYFCSSPSNFRFNVSAFMKFRVRAPLSAVTAITTISIDYRLIKHSSVVSVVEPVIVLVELEMGLQTLVIQFQLQDMMGIKFLFLECMMVFWLYFIQELRLISELRAH